MRFIYTNLCIVTVPGQLNLNLIINLLKNLIIKLLTIFIYKKRNFNKHLTKILALQYR